MNSERHPADPKNALPVGGDKRATDPKHTGSDDTGCATPKGDSTATNAGSSPAASSQPDAPGPHPTPCPTPTDSNERAAAQGPQSPLTPQPLGPPKGHTTGQQLPSTTPGPTQPGQPEHSGRPGGDVQTDQRGKTYEGETGVSGETAESAGSGRAAPMIRSPLPSASAEGAPTMAHDDRPNDIQPRSQAPAAKPAPLPDPQAVLEDPTLSRDEKIDKLRRWSQDAREVETANDEGMRGVAAPSNLQAVQKALRELGASENPETDTEASAGS